METLQKRHIIQKGCTLIFDKGYCSYENYQLGISKYKIVPFFPRDNFKRNKLNNQLSYSLQAFKKTKKIIAEKRFHDNLKHEFLKKLDKCEKFKPILGKNRRLFLITQTMTQHGKNTQICTKIS